MKKLRFDPGQQYPILPSQFIPGFCPEQLLPGKNLWLCVESDGWFVIKRNGKEVVPNLSETDEIVFRYLSFLHLCRCFGTVEELEMVEIPDFSDRLDESVDFTDLLRRGEVICGCPIILV